MSSSRYAVNPEDFQNLSAKLLYISSSRYGGDWQSIPHIHHFSEIIYVVDGKGRFFLNGTDYPITAGDLVIVSPNLEHTEKSYASHPMEYIVLGIEGITFQSSGPGDGHLIYNYRRDPDVPMLLNLLLKEAQREQEGSGLVCQNLLEVLLIHIFRMQKVLPAPFCATKMTKECGLIKRYLDSNFSETITLDQLASLAHMNKYYLVHAFTRHTGLSPISYLNMKRLETSRELLSTTNYPIASVASLVGFSSQSYFAQVFKKETGMTPAQYRKSYACEHH